MLPSIHGSPDLDDRTRIVPAVVRPDDRTAVVPVVRRPSRLRTLLPWAGFGVVAVVVVAATSAWAATLRSGDGPLLVNAAPPVAAAVAPPVAATTVDVTARPEPTRARAPRRTVAPVPAAAPAGVSTTPTVRPTAATTAPTTRAAPTTTRRVGILGGPASPTCSPPTACPARTGPNPAP